MRRQQHEGLAWYTFEGPDDTFQHAVVTRLGGVSKGPFASLNLGSTVGDHPEAVRENHRRLFAAFRLHAAQVVSPHQVHGRKVTRVGRDQGGTIIPATDALITDEPGVALLLRFADCTPVLFYDPDHRAVGLAHAGWRGAAAGIVQATVEAMQKAFGTTPQTLWAGIGPAIDPEHYVVGAEVVEAIQARLPGESTIAWSHNGDLHLDLPGAVLAQLKSAGVEHVEPSQLYTARRTDEWYSHRAEGGRTGRFGVLAYLSPVVS
ncbi:MAG: peptidoglycan editing factor PgeF [Anaerolineae bacterium]